MIKAPINMTPGDDTHLTLLMAPVSLNFVTGQDREHLLAYGRAAFEAGQKCQGCAVQQGYVPVETLSATIKKPIDALIERLRSLPNDHKPDGWPAVQTKEITALLDHIAELKGQLEAIGAGGVEPLRKQTQLAAVQQGVQQEPWCPDVCPITGRKFFMWIEHWETGKDVPTYGGPYDSYTIPVKDSDGTFSCERYDHDAGEWMTEGMGWECVGLMLVDDQSFVVEPNNPRYMEIENYATHPTQQGLDAPTEAARSVLAERARQIAAEGYTPEQDDGYNPGVLALHGGLYACHAYDNLTKKRAPEGWQWDAKWWKSKDPRSNLVRAGALILAEIERMDRSFAAQAKQGGV